MSVNGCPVFHGWIAAVGQPGAGNWIYGGSTVTAGNTGVPHRNIKLRQIRHQYACVHAHRTHWIRGCPGSCSSSYATLSPCQMRCNGAGTLTIPWTYCSGGATTGAPTCINQQSGIGPLTTYAPILSGISALAYDSSGTLFAVRDSTSVIYTISADGATATSWGNNGYAGATGLAFDSSGTLFVAVPGVNVISRVPASSGAIGSGGCGVSPLPLVLQR